MIQAVETALASGSALCYQELQEVPEPVASIVLTLMSI